MQLLRTYPAKRPAHPFAPQGERSIARAYLQAFERARRFITSEVTKWGNVIRDNSITLDG